jgi:hypothetical protein
MNIQFNVLNKQVARSFGRSVEEMFFMEINFLPAQRDIVVYRDKEYSIDTRRFYEDCIEIDVLKK